MDKIKTVEIVVRGDVMERGLLIKLADRISERRLRADFSSSVAVPPFLTAMERGHPSLAVLYCNVEVRDIFSLRGLIDGLCQEEGCEVLSYKEL